MVNIFLKQNIVLVITILWVIVVLLMFLIARTIIKKRKNRNDTEESYKDNDVNPENILDIKESVKFTQDNDEDFNIPFQPSTEIELKNKIIKDNAFDLKKDIDVLNVENSVPIRKPEVKNFSRRDCGIDKNGKEYTVEELNKQIRE